MPEDLSVKELRTQISDIDCQVQDFLCGNCTPYTRDILSRHDVETPQLENLLHCSTTCLSQSALQAIESKLLHLLLTRLTSVFRILISSTSTSSTSHGSQEDIPISQLVHQALDMVRGSQERPRTGARPPTTFRPVSTRPVESIPVIPPTLQPRPTSRLSTSRTSDTDGQPADHDYVRPPLQLQQQRSSRSDSSSPPLRSCSSRLTRRKFHPLHNSLRSRTRTISRQSSTTTISLPSNDAQCGNVQRKVQELEDEIDSLKKNELLLLTYPDPYGPCSTRPSGDAALDMRMQIIANKLRIQLLEKQSRQLNNVLQERKRSSFDEPRSDKNLEEYALPSVSMASHSSIAHPASLSTERSAKADLMTYDYGLSDKDGAFTARSSLSSASTATAGTVDIGGRHMQGRRMRSSLLGDKPDVRSGTGDDLAKFCCETPRKTEEPFQSPGLPLKTNRVSTSRIASAHKKPAAIVPLPRFR